MNNRSKWKGPFVDPGFLKKQTENDTAGQATSSKISRNSTILPVFLDQGFRVHNGKAFTEIIVTETMVGCKFGEMVPTRKDFILKKQKKKQKN